MTQSFEELASLDRVIHEPARLVIMTALSGCESADFLFMQRLTGLTKGNLSSHLSKLEEAGLINIVKQFKGKIPNTMLGLTPKGRDAIKQHWDQLDQLRKKAGKWKLI